MGTERACVGRLISSIKTGQGIGLSDDASSQGRTPWLMEIAVNAKCCLKLFRPDPRSRHHQRYCSVPGLQNGQQSRQPSTLARQTREPRLLPRLDKRRPGPRVAVAPSGLLAQGSTCRRCVTRSLNCATHWFCVRNKQNSSHTVTRSHNRATHWFCE